MIENERRKWEDPIVAEVHRRHAELAAKHNYDIKAFFADLRRQQAASGRLEVLQQSHPEPGNNGVKGRSPSESRQTPGQAN